MPWPFPPVLDDMNRPDESPLSDGGNWTQWTGLGSTNALDLVSHAAQKTPAGGTSMERWTPATFGPDACSSIGIVNWYRIGGVGGEFDAYISGQGPLDTDAYAVELTIDPTGAPVSAALRRKGSHAWFSAVSTAGFPAHVSPGDQLGIAANGRTIEAWYISGTSATLVGSADDATLSGGAAALGVGYAGFGMNFGGVGAEAMRAAPFRAGPYASSLFRLPLLGAG